jgi:hypothetical protein
VIIPYDERIRSLPCAVAEQRQQGVTMPPLTKIIRKLGIAID